MDCTGSSVHGILQVRILEWVAISFARASSWPRDQRSPAVQADSLPSEPPGKPTIKETFPSIKTGHLKKYQQIKPWLYLIIYRQYVRICNESIYLFQRNTRDRSSNEIINNNHQSDELISLGEMGTGQVVRKEIQCAFKIIANMWTNRLTLTIIKLNNEEEQIWGPQFFIMWICSCFTYVT